MEWILNHGGSVLDRDELGGTLVHDAAEQGQVSISEDEHKRMSLAVFLTGMSPPPLFWASTPSNPDHIQCYVTRSGIHMRCMKFEPCLYHVRDVHVHLIMFINVSSYSVYNVIMSLLVHKFPCY